MCECASISPGITVLPLRSTRVAPRRTATSPRRPTAAKRLLSTTKAEFSIGAPPSPVISRAPSYTVTAVWLLASDEASAAKNRHAVNSKDEMRLRRRIETLLRHRRGQDATFQHCQQRWAHAGAHHPTDGRGKDSLR